MLEEQLNGMVAAVQERSPLKRLGQPKEIASMVAFLASDEASFITGGEYNVDGGMNINPLLG
jgi:NAD(P)-dependent dehydrogenase (short-subunit alcohol dehydrogenase family)